jgi:uncharacterized repeat protein (TIGR02543 family)
MNKKFFSLILMTTLFAVVLSSCKKDTPTFTVTFDSKGGTPTPATQTVEKGGMVEKPADPTLTNYQFAGWTTADNATSPLWDFATGTVIADMTLYAKWDSPTFSVTFDSKGGTPTPATQTIEKDGMVEKPADPTLTNYQFAGWITDENETSSLWDFENNTVTADMTLYAKWSQTRLEINGYSVIVLCDENGTAGVTSVTPVEEGMLITLTAIANSGYCFVEWNIDGYCTSKDNPASLIMPTNYPSHDTQWEAIFVQIPTVTVLSDENGTASANVTSSGWGSWLVTLTATANSGYRFLEWQVIKGDITLSSTIDNPAIFYISNDSENEEIEVKAIFVPSVGLPESIIVSRNDYQTKYEYVYDSQNRIARRTYNGYSGSNLTFNYNAIGDLTEYNYHYMLDSKNVTFSKNGNKITFISSFGTRFYSRTENGELELNAQGLPVKLTSENVIGQLGTSPVRWSYTLTLTWQNGNLIKTEWVRKDENGSSAGTKTCTYDDKKTPFSQCNTPKWFFWWIDFFGHENVFYGNNKVYNKNNIKTETRENGHTITYEYTYNDDGFPVTRTWVAETNTYTQTYTYH